MNKRAWNASTDRDAALRRSPVMTIALVGALVLAAAALAWWFGRSEPPPTAPSGVTVVRAPVAPPQPYAGLTALEVHGVVMAQQPGSSRALIGPPGSPGRLYHVGEAVADGVILQSVLADHVVVLDRGRTVILKAPQPTADPVPVNLGEQAGVVVEPKAPSGEMSGAELLARKQAAGPEPVRRTPEEEAAGR